MKNETMINNKKCPNCAYAKNEGDIDYKRFRVGFSNIKMAVENKKSKTGTEKQSSITKHKKKKLLAFFSRLFIVVSIIGLTLIPQLTEHVIPSDTEQAMLTEIKKLTTITSEKQEACNQFCKDGATMEARDGYVYVTNIDIGIDSCEQASEYGKKLQEKFMEFSKLSADEFLGFLSSEPGNKAENTLSRQIILSLDISGIFYLISQTIDTEYLKALISNIDQEKQDYFDKVMRLKEIESEIANNADTFTNEMVNYFEDKK